MARLHAHPIPSLAWMECRHARTGRDRACLNRRILPAYETEQTIRPCDVCPCGTKRARAEASHAQRMSAQALGIRIAVAI
jgi:hypothetical protein